MPKFLFKFQSLLNVKEKLQEQKETEFGKAVQSLEFEKKKLSILIKTRDYNIDELRNSIETSVSPRQISEFNSYINKLKNDIELQQNVIKKSEDFVEKKRLELQEAMAETKKYEKLKEKEYEQYVMEIKSKENIALDEIVTYRFSNSEWKSNKHIKIFFYTNCINRKLNVKD